MKRSLKIAVVTAIVAALGALALVQVSAQAVTVTREISPATLPAGGGEATVTITIAGSYGGIGVVEETLPDGYSYVDGSGSIAPTVDGKKLTFALVADTSFSYKVMIAADADASDTLMGALTYGLVTKTTVPVTGHTSVTVEPSQQPTGVTVTRAISPRVRGGRR